jgi:hypothetical protein
MSSSAKTSSGYASAIMAIISHIALKLLSGARPTTSFKNRRKKAGWNVDYWKLCSGAPLDVHAIRLALRPGRLDDRPPF